MVEQCTSGLHRHETHYINYCYFIAIADIERQLFQQKLISYGKLAGDNLTKTLDEVL
jgi:hypothetical protein